MINRRRDFEQDTPQRGPVRWGVRDCWSAGQLKGGSTVRRIDVEQGVLAAPEIYPTSLR